MLKYCIQSHHAKRAGHHWDFRLQKPNSDMMWSWVIPKHRLPSKGERLLAIKVQDHPIDWCKFEGEIEEGYGAGKVDLVDMDSYSFVSNASSKKCFELDGEVDGKYCLVRMGNTNKWLIIPK